MIVVCEKLIEGHRDQLYGSWPLQFNYVTTLKRGNWLNSYNAKQLAEVTIHFLLRMAPPQAYRVPRSAMTATIHGQEPRLAADPPVTNLSGLSSSSLT